MRKIVNKKRVWDCGSTSISALRLRVCVCWLDQRSKKAEKNELGIEGGFSVVL